MSLCSPQRPRFRGSAEQRSTQMLNSLLALLFVFALLGGCLWLLRRWSPHKTQGRNLSVVETLPLGPNKTLSLVRVGQRLFLLAATNERMSLISELDPEELSEGLPDEARASPFSALFSRRLPRASEQASEHS